MPADRKETTLDTRPGAGSGHPPDCKSENAGSTPARASHSACRSGKRIYGNERVATRAVNVARDRGELPPMKHYQCPDCGHWHLAKKERPRNG